MGDALGGAQPLSLALPPHLGASRPVPSRFAGEGVAPKGPMPMSLPPLKWVASPNFNSRHGTRVDQIIIHDMEGSYAGSVQWFAQARSQVSAHFCVRGDGGEATQMVHLSDRAWHACAANSRSIGIEMEGYARNGYKPELLEATAAIAAYLCHYLQIPVRHARGGVGPGIESHWGLGVAGGRHFDPSTDPAFMDRFVAMVQAAYDKADFQPEWEPEASGGRPCPLDHARAPAASAGPALDLSTTAGVQQALNALGADLKVDGIKGPSTYAAIEAFQRCHGLSDDGVLGQKTRIALLTAQGG